MRNKSFLFLLIALFFSANGFAQKKKNKKTKKSKTTLVKNDPLFSAKKFSALKWRNIGPFRGGRSNASSGVIGDPMTYYFGSVGGGVWKTTDAGTSWKNISDGFFKSASVGAIAVATSDQNVIYVGMGEHAVRGVMSSHGDGMYKSTDAGKTWKHIGLKDSRHIAAIRVHPTNSEVIYVAVQGSIWTTSKDKGIYKSTDGGTTWKQILFVDENTAAADLSMDASNPRILYAGMWDNKRDPWRVRSGGKGSGLYKSIDAGATWNKINKGLPKLMGKVAVDVSPADPNIVYANIEAEGKKGGVYRSNDAGNSWQQVNSDRVTVARAWYYIEIFADPVDAETVYVLNAPMLRSIDGGKTFKMIPNPHSDQHHLWINPDNPKNMILSNDGGACISFNTGKTWSTENNQPTAQFYRVITDNQFPYHIYGGQQDNSTVCIASKTNFGGISENDWYPVAGGESAFIAFNNPDDPQKIYGTTIQGFIDQYDKQTKMIQDIMAYPAINLGTIPKDQKYRFNWNGPLAHNNVNPQILYHGANKLLRSDNQGFKWTEISPDLTRNDTSKHSMTGVPFTNEAAGGEVYNTISYIASSPHELGTIWVGTDDGLVQLTRDEGKHWKKVSPPVNGESLINAIEVSPHDKAKVYLAVTRYKYDDLRPMIFVSNDYGTTWKSIVNGLPKNNFVRVVREDPQQEGLLYAGTEHGLYLSFNNGNTWQAFQSNLPVCPITDLIIKDNDLVAATSGRAFWVLDDLAALQQSMGKPDTTAIQLFAPKTTYKFTLGGGFGSSANRGKNPLPGITFDYYLPHNFEDSLELKLEIVDVNNNIVRTMTNQKDKEFKKWFGGPSPAKTIPSQPGLNRSNWDLRRDGLPGVEGIFVMGGYQGSMVGPGTYTLRLMQGDHIVEQKVELKADPRIDATKKDFELQENMLLEIEGTVKDIHESVTRLRSVKTQLEARLDLLKKMDDVKELLKIGEGAMKAINNWEGDLVQAKQKTFQDVINFENQLNAELLMLKSKVDSYNPKQTDGIKNRLKELTGQWTTRKTEMNRIIKEDVGGFSKLYKESNLPILIVPDLKIIKP